MAQQGSLLKRTVRAIVGMALVFTLLGVIGHFWDGPTQKGSSLAPIVSRTLKGAGVTATNVTCADYKLGKGVTVNCLATIKGRRTTVRATFVDEQTVIVDPPKPAAKR
jgi:hypothetical protein